MKKIYTLLTIFLSISFYAQIPQGFSYQTIIRNNTGSLITNQNVNIKFSIFQNSPTGLLVYSETQNATTDNFGYVSLIVGKGIPITGTFARINWGNASYYLGIALDTGSGYVTLGVKQLLSVPYALYAGNTTIPGGFKHYIGELFNGGIIFELYKGNDGLEHGLIVALTESTAEWQNIASLVYSNSSFDGVQNTILMTNSPAKDYILTLGTGWYLPSIDELGKLFYNRFYVNKALRSGNYTLLSNTTVYWSSTEDTTVLAYNFSFFQGRSFSDGKYYTKTVRGIKSF